MRLAVAYLVKIGRWVKPLVEYRIRGVLHELHQVSASILSPGLTIAHRATSRIADSHEL